MSTDAPDPMRITTLECEAFIEGWYRDLVDPGYLGINLEEWLWYLHFPGLARSPSTMHVRIAGLHWMSAFDRPPALEAVISANYSRRASELPASMPELGDLGLVWLALARGDDDLVSANDAQRSLVVSARALALVRRSQWYCEVLSERALFELVEIAAAAAARRQARA
jgi:hypothetical protein